MSNRITTAMIAASVSLCAASAAMAGGTTNSNPYVAGDMHNHNTCTDGSVSVGYALDRSVAKGTNADGSANWNLDWFTLGNHGGNGNRDCRFSDTSAQLGQTTKLWTDTLGQTIDGITVTKLLGANPTSGNGPSKGYMWRWQNLIQVEYPYIVDRSKKYNKVLIDGLEWIVPGHEHADVAVINNQTPLAANTGNPNYMAQFEYLYDAADGDTQGLTGGAGKAQWPGKDNTNNVGTAGHTIKTLNAAKWLQKNFPVTSYIVPTHVERKGPFSATANLGWNIEHFRDLNNAAPTVAFGIESPGHAAQGNSTVNASNEGVGSYKTGAIGGGTYGMAGVYHAKVGGVWDGLLGEGRNEWMFISSDWHTRGIFGANDTRTTSDFQPGEYAKLYLPNEKSFTSSSVIGGMRSGNSYSVLGDLVGPNLRFAAWSCNVVNQCTTPVTMGQTLVANPGDIILVRMQMTVPAKNNSPYSFNNPLLAQAGIKQPLNKPSLDHVDLITGNVTGVVDPSSDSYKKDVNGKVVVGSADDWNLVYNSSAKVAKQVAASKMGVVTNTDGSKTYSFQTTFTMGTTPWYIRARGTNLPVALPNVTDSAGNPLVDLNNAKVVCSDPACPAHLDTDANKNLVVSYDVQAWSHQWFYANPIFVRTPANGMVLAEINAKKAYDIINPKK